MKLKYRHGLTSSKHRVMRVAPVMQKPSEKGLVNTNLALAYSINWGK